MSPSCHCISQTDVQGGERICRRCGKTRGNNGNNKNQDQSDSAGNRKDPKGIDGYDLKDFNGSDDQEKRPSRSSITARGKGKDPNDPDESDNQGKDLSRPDSTHPNKTGGSIDRGKYLNKSGDQNKDPKKAGGDGNHQGEGEGLAINLPPDTLAFSMAVAVFAVGVYISTHSGI